MHWAEKIASQLIEMHPEQQAFVCASGISPSGSVHIGNFREIATTYFVSKALEKAGKEVRFIFSWDDFDRFRKVPNHVDPGFERYIGLPYSKVPCPFGCHSSYAEHFEQEFEQALMAFGITPEFIYQSREYQSRRYNPAILQALCRRGEIYDILMSFKTGEASAEDRAAFYPVHVYCEQCGKDSTTVVDFDDQAETLTYTCTCGQHNTVSVPEAAIIKLHWKIDWPMRWGMEGVACEPGGRDHSSETGSFNVASVISAQIFENKPPYYVPYEFISIKGSHAKMSSSSGNHYTPADLLKVYTPENLLFLFAKYQPNAAFHIGMDEDVLRNYAEFERFREAYPSPALPEEKKAALELSMHHVTEAKAPSFSQVSGILPLVDFDFELLKEIMARNGGGHNEELLQQTANRAEFWIRQWVPQRMITVNTEPDIAYYQTLEPGEQEWIKDFCSLLRREGMDEQELMTEIYAICHDKDKKIMKNNQKRLFKIIYQFTLNQQEGPRIPVLIQVLGAGQLLDLLDFS